MRGWGSTAALLLTGFGLVWLGLAQAVFALEAGRPVLAVAAFVLCAPGGILAMLGLRAAGVFSVPAARPVAVRHSATVVAFPKARSYQK